METVGKKIEDGRKIISESLVRLYAFSHPENGDAVASWVAAEKWFKEQGCGIVSDEEYSSYKFRVIEIPGDGSTLYFIK
ncbi:hypothetical protein KKH14_01200 [Patescibacteria group bacterium]|nr:hypothetical protein [Patescibacteria group bacterium]